MVAHTVDMFFKIAVADKFCQCVLLEIGNGSRVKGKLFVKAGKQVGRQHHVADPDGGGQALGKGIDIYYPLRFIYTLKGWNRARRKAEFRVVIILDYIVGNGGRGIYVQYPHLSGLILPPGCPRNPY